MRRPGSLRQRRVGITSYSPEFNAPRMKIGLPLFLLAGKSFFAPSARLFLLCPIVIRGAQTNQHLRCNFTRFFGYKEPIPGTVRGVVRTCQLDRLPGIKFGWHDCMLLSRRIHRNGWHLLHIPLNKMIMSISSNKMTE